MFILSQ